jgi:hypothetical protein
MTLESQSLNLAARQILLKRLSTSQALAYTGPLGEVIVDTNLKLLRIQDGVTPGGFVMATSANIAYLQNQINSILNNIDPSALDSLSEVVANVNALLANNVESQLVNSGFYANLSATGNLTIDGSLLPKTHVAQDLGSPTQAWRDLYLSNATAYFGTAAVTVTNNGLTVSMAGNVLPVIANVRFPDGTTQRTAVDMAILANIYTLLTPNVSANLTTIHADVTNATSYFGNLTDAAVSTLQANLQSQIDYIKTNIDPAALDSLSEIVAAFQGVDANVIANISTIQTRVGNLESSSDRLVNGSANLILTGGANPYTTFPAVSTGEQLFVQGSEVASETGNLALTSRGDLYVISNGEGVGGGSFLWKFNAQGGIVLPNSAVIKDSSTNTIAFGRNAGAANQGNLTVALGDQAGENNQGNQATAVGSGAGNYNQSSGTVAIGSLAGSLNQGLRATAIGSLAGASNQGEYAVAIGNFAGGTDQPNNSIMINASGSALNGTEVGLYINPIREDSANIAKAVYYNTVTKEVTYANPTGGASLGNLAVAGSRIYNTDGNIELTANDGVVSQTWRFDPDGGIRTPNELLTIGGYTILTNNNNELDLSNSSDITIRSNVGGVALGANWGSSQAEWRFEADGNLTLPQTAMDVSPAPVISTGIRFTDGTLQITAFTGSSAKVDIVNTNGLTTTYYPTFVEATTNAQEMRADVDLTYRTDDNLLRSGNIQVGHNIYGSYRSGLSNAIEFRPNIDIDKRFLFTVDSSGGTYVRSSMEMPSAEVDKAVTLAFPHLNSNAGYIYVQGADTSGTEFNDAFNIMMNSGNVKISALSGGGNKVWNFTTSGQLIYPDATVQTTAFTGTATPNNIINTHGGIDTIIVGSTQAVFGSLSVRVTNASNTLGVEVQYSDANTATISAFRSHPNTTNIYAGTVTKLGSNTDWDNFGNLTTVGDSMSFTVSDHSYHKIYRVLVTARAIPDGGSSVGDAYCVIEKLK